MTSFSRFSAALKQLRSGGSGTPTVSESYVFSPEMEAAIDVAIGLGRPLLVTGEPGVGKTRLGSAIANVLGLPKPHVFVTRSTTEARDVFYRYDALARFRDAQVTHRDTALPAPGTYLQFEALGRAILEANDAAGVQPLVAGSGSAWLPPDKPRQTVAIIDEIDKAPRDVANDMLNEIETYRFTVPELVVHDANGQRMRHETLEIPLDRRPIVIFTSNSERQLPDAFLRRCVFLEIDFPKPENLRKILETEIRQRGGGGGLDGTDRTMSQLVELVGKLRNELSLRKPPSVAETIDALKVLTAEGEQPMADRWKRLKYVLAKQVNDRKDIEPKLAEIPV